MEWISVREKLPEKDICDVIVRLATEKTEVATFFLPIEESGSRFYKEYRKHFDDITSLVTHWADLPKDHN